MKEFELKIKSLIKIESLLYLILKGQLDCSVQDIYKIQKSMNEEVDKQYKKLMEEMGE